MSSSVPDCITLQDGKEIFIPTGGVIASITFCPLAKHVEFLDTGLCANGIEVEEKVRVSGALPQTDWHRNHR
jgi:hypothetical protein